MNNSLNFACSVYSQPRLGRGLFSLSVIGAFCLTSASLFAQDPAPVAETPGGRRRNTTPGETSERAERRNLTPEDMQARMLTQMRERFEVTDDEEWKLISERIAKVMELRRAVAPGGAGFGGFGTRGPAGNNDARVARGGRGGAGGSGEVAALSTALRDKLPDAEVKARLDRLRETRKENESKLVKAQEDLRAVLSVRQEAVAVVFGMLP